MHILILHGRVLFALSKEVGTFVSLIQKTPVFNTSKKDIGCQYSVVFNEKNKIVVKSLLR